MIVEGGNRRIVDRVVLHLQQRHEKRTAKPFSQIFPFHPQEHYIKMNFDPTEYDRTEGKTLYTMLPYDVVNGVFIIPDEEATILGFSLAGNIRHDTALGEKVIHREIPVENETISFYLGLAHGRIHGIALPDSVPLYTGLRAIRDLQKHARDHSMATGRWYPRPVLDGIKNDHYDLVARATEQAVNAHAQLVWQKMLDDTKP